jgi:phage protein D
MRSDHAILQVRVQLEGKKAAPVDLSERVMTFALTDHSAKADRMTLTVDNSDLRNFDDPIWRKGNIIEVMWGYLGNTDSRRCVIKHIHGGTKLTIEAVALSMVMNQVKKCRVWENMTLKQIADKISFEYASILDYEAKVSKDKNLQTLGDNIQIIHATQAALTDMEFLARLAKKYGLAISNDRSGKIRFSEPNLKGPPVRTLTWRGGAGDWEDFEIRNDIINHVGAVTAKGIDTATKQEVAHRADNASTNREGLAQTIEVVDARTGETHYAQRASGESVESVNTHEAGKEHVQAQAEGKFKASQRSVVKLWGTCVGDPRIGATRLLMVEGLGKRLSGRYKLVETWHDVSEAGKYKTTFRANSDGDGGYGSGAVGQNVASDATKNNEKALDADAQTMETREVVDYKTGQQHYEFHSRGSN